ncbi:exodeoxyribonuclease VII large subunit [Panacagrimonas sp.]|uniref:exodeoxyribonuclease VII large subunit n=1 Tax=Panacagrimonas sp. TaxID=2480088 RepID=UPI003B517AE0
MNSSPARTVHSVSDLAEILRALVEDSLPRLWVEGEISNFSRPASGHWYFTLKDERAQIRCAMFRNTNYVVAAQPRNGDRVLVRASASFYTARGDLQLICEHLEPAGEGALLREFEALKRRLSAEGLFDPARKRPIPERPHRIGLITSATGAAVQDVLAALSRRFPLLQVALWPVPVQGATAAPAIVRALRELPRRAQIDALLLVRGGGSLEDLWAFNEEIVVRAVAACAVPVITGIGHEIDFSIADFAADLRAPTPTAAAELISPDQATIRARLAQAHSGLNRDLLRRILHDRTQLQQQRDRLHQRHPQRQLHERAQMLDEMTQRLGDGWQQRLQRYAERHHAQHIRLALRDPRPRLAAARRQLDLAATQLQRNLRAALLRHAERWQQKHSLLRSVSPQAVLDRGYAIATTAEGHVVRDATSLAPQQRFNLVLARGRITARRDG